MNDEQGILSAAQMAVEKGSGEPEDDDDEEVCDERVGGEARELTEDSPLRGRVLANEAAMREGEGGEDEGEGEGGEALAEGEGEGEAGTGGGRLTKPKKLATSPPACNTWLVPQLTQGSSSPSHTRTGQGGDVTVAVLPRGTRASSLSPQVVCGHRHASTLCNPHRHPRSCGFRDAQVSCSRRAGRRAS